MAQGLQVFDEQGNCTLDLTMRLAKIIGKKTATGNGEMNVADFDCPDNRFWYCITKEVMGEEGNPKDYPVLRISDDGKKIMWENADNRRGKLEFLFGVY